MSTKARCLEATEGPGSGSGRRLLFPRKEHRTSVTASEFKRWLKQFDGDGDGDGRISRRELREAIRRRGAWLEMKMLHKFSDRIRDRIRLEGFRYIHI
jgi:Ca2+-binding EF-hand superfamily protein